MNIAVWAPFLSKQVSDFENFIVETIPYFMGQHQNNKFFILTDTARSGQFTFSGNTEIIITRPQQDNALLRKIWWDVKLPPVLKKIKADQFVSFDERCSLTVAIPQFIFSNETERLSSSFIKKAQSVFVISETIKQQLIKSHKISGEKIVVIYPSPGRYYSLIDATKKEDIKREYSEGKEFYLYNSSFKEQEDIIDLLKSFSQFKKRQQSSFKLLILAESNPFFKQTLSAYKYRNDVKLIGAKDQKIRAAITTAAYAVVLPFNSNEDIIAALNAMRSGVPLIATKNSGVNEVADDAAVYAEMDIKDIGEKMMQLYRNESFRSMLIQKGRERIREYTHEKAAESLGQAIRRPIK